MKKKYVLKKFCGACQLVTVHYPTSKSGRDDCVVCEKCGNYKKCKAPPKPGVPLKHKA